MKKNHKINSLLLLVFGLFVIFGLWKYRVIFPDLWGTKNYEENHLATLDETNSIPDDQWTNSLAIWTNSPTLTLTNTDKHDVLIKLLELNREDITFWQGQLFTITLGINGAIFAIVAFILQRKRRGSETMIYFGSASICLCLGIFYLLFLKFAEDAMAANEHDLQGIQIGLQLTTGGAYLGSGQSIYHAGPRSLGAMGHDFIWQFALFNVVLVIGSIFILVASYFQKPPEPPVGSTEKSSKNKHH